MEAQLSNSIGQLLAADMLPSLSIVQLSVLLTLTDTTTGQRELIRALRTAAEESLRSQDDEPG